jgi:hypothetical protein
MHRNIQERIRTNLTLKNPKKKKMKDYNKERAKRLKEWTAWFK